MAAAEDMDAGDRVDTSNIEVLEEVVSGEVVEEVVEIKSLSVAKGAEVAMVVYGSSGPGTRNLPIPCIAALACMVTAVVLTVLCEILTRDQVCATRAGV